MEGEIQILSTAIVAIATVVLVWLTSKYVRLTRHIVDEMKVSREPLVYVDIEAPETVLRLTVGNSGQTPAVNIRFVVEKDIKGLVYGKAVSGVGSIPVIQKGLSYLTPGRTLKWVAGYFRPSEKERMDNVLQMRIIYENEERKKFDRSVVIDMSMYDAVLFESYRDPARDVAKAIKESERMHRSREHVTKFFGMLGFKKCPMCAEKIPSAAKKCSHCGELIENKEEVNEVNGEA